MILLDGANSMRRQLDDFTRRGHHVAPRTPCETTPLAVAQPLTSKFAAYDAFEKRERCTRVQRPPTSIQYLLLDAVLNL